MLLNNSLPVGSATQSSSIRVFFFASFTIKINSYSSHHYPPLILRLDLKILYMSEMVKSQKHCWSHRPVPVVQSQSRWEFINYAAASFKFLTGITSTVRSFKKTGCHPFFLFALNQRKIFRPSRWENFCEHLSSLQHNFIYRWRCQTLSVWLGYDCMTRHDSYLIKGIVWSQNLKAVMFTSGAKKFPSAGSS